MANLQLEAANTAKGFDRLRAAGRVAVPRALNRAIGSAKVAMARLIADDMRLKVGDVTEKIRVEEARPDKLVARLYASPKRIPLIDFAAKGPEPSRGKGRGVTANLGGGRNRYPNAFIATMRSGHRGVFARKAKARLPIRELFGPSIAFVFQKHHDVGLARGREQLEKNLRSEFRFALSQSAA
jgi:hypothetical protein